MAIKKEKKPVAKKAKTAKKEAKVPKTNKKTEGIKEIANLIDNAIELAENQIASIEVTPEPEIIMTTPDAFNSINDVNDITESVAIEKVSTNINPSASDQQRALDIIANIKDKIQFNIHQKEVEKKDNVAPVEKVVEKEVEKKPEPVVQELTQEQIEEGIFENFIAMRPGAIEINHFELAYAGINVARFEQFEGRIGKYKLNRVYIGGPWTFTISK